MSAGQMTWEEFLCNAEAFLKLSQKIGDNWTLVTVSEDTAGSYLSLRLHKDVSHLTTAGGEEFLVFEYHLTYSLSYAVPLLFFSVQTLQGRSLTLSEFREIFMSMLDRTGGCEVDLNSAVTQAEHPLLFRPYLSIHPCRTAELLGRTESTNKIVTFLSLYGPFVCLEMDPQYGVCDK